MEEKDDDVTQEQLNKESRYNSLMSIRSRIEKDRTRILKSLGRELKTVSELQVNFAENTEIIIEQQKVLSRELDRTVRALKNYAGTIKKVYSIAETSTENLADETERQVDAVNNLVQAQRRLNNQIRRQPGPNRGNQGAQNSSGGGGSAIGRVIGSQTQSIQNAPQTGGGTITSAVTSMGSRIGGVFNKGMGILVSAVESLGDKITGAVTWLWETIKKALVDNTRSASRLSRLSEGIPGASNEARASLQRSIAIIERTNEITRQLAELSSQMGTYDIQALMPDVLIETQLLRSRESIQGITETLEDMMRVSLQLKEIADLDMAESLDLIQNRATQLSRGTASDIRSETRRLAQLAEIPEIIAQNLESSGITVGRFAFSFRRDFLKLMIETNKQLETQASNLNFVGSSMAYVAQEAVRLGSSVDSATKIAKAFRDTLFPEKDDAISFMAGERMMREFQQDSRAFLESLRSQGMDPDAVQEIERVMSGGGALAGLEALNIARQSEQASQAILDTIQDLTGNLGLTERRLLLRQTGYFEGLDTLQGRQMLRTLEAAQEGEWQTTGGQRTRAWSPDRFLQTSADIGARALSIAAGSERGLEAMNQRVEGLRTTALTERTFGRFEDEFIGVIRSILPSTQTIAEYLPKIAEMLPRFFDFDASSMGNVFVPGYDRILELERRNRPYQTQPDTREPGVQRPFSGSSPELDLNIQSVDRQGNARVTGTIRGVTRAVDQANGQIGSELGDGDY